MDLAYEYYLEGREMTSEERRDEKFRAMKARSLHCKSEGKMKVSRYRAILLPNGYYALGGFTFMELEAFASGVLTESDIDEDQVYILTTDQLNEFEHWHKCRCISFESDPSLYVSDLFFFLRRLIAKGVLGSRSWLKK